MPNESQRWLIKEYIRTALDAIAEPTDWNTTGSGSARAGHVPVDSMLSVEGPWFTYQDADGSTIAEERTQQMDSGLVVLSIRGFKETEYIEVDQCQEREREAERLLKDMWRAVMKNPSMNCNATSIEVTGPTRAGSVMAHPGWVEAEMTILVTYQNNRLDP